MSFEGALRRTNVDTVYANPFLALVLRLAIDESVEILGEHKMVIYLVFIVDEKNIKRVSIGVCASPKEDINRHVVLPLNSWNIFIVTGKESPE